MKQKIEWYREVLELEPGSRVFFPLAKLLAADGQIHEAIITLRQGVLRHPDHIESRLLLVELLFSHQGASSDLQFEVEKLGRMLGTYPGFWNAWGALLAKTPAMQDAALAVRFFAAALQGQPLTWASVIEQGLQSALVAAAEYPTAPLAEVACTSAEPCPAPSLPHEEAQPSGFPERMPPERRSLHTAEADAEDSAEDEETEEAFSIRTRSMAEVLAEQGDLAGALDIYHELIQAAPAAEKPSLASRAEELTKRLQSGPVQGPGETEEKVFHPGGESNRLVELLESLAQRLEARAR